jgi:Taurine catabolism dioxygenase TauD, TfdA family
MHFFTTINRSDIAEAPHFKPIRSPAAWTAAEAWAVSEKWTHQLSSEDLAELGHAADSAISSQKPLHTITSKDAFPLPTLGPKLDFIRKDVSFGRGFTLIKGIPVAKWSRQKTVTAYWLIGLQWGNLKVNTKHGHLIGHIKDIGHDISNPDTRLYATHEAQPFHNDGCADLVSLLCLSTAKEGGASHWASSISIYNEIVAQRPDLAEILAQPWYFDKKGVPLSTLSSQGNDPFFTIPVFNFHKGQLSINYSDNYFYSAQRHPQVPRLTPAQLEAMKLFNELAASDKLRMDYILEPGDIQLLSNHTVLHARGSYIDHDEDPAKKRHLLRLWVAPEDERPLSDAYAGLMGGSVVAGERGGIVCEEGVPLYVPLEAA